MKRFATLLSFFLLIPSGPGAETLDPATAKPDADGKLLWYDIRPLGVEGQGWTDTKSPFDRLPAKAEGKVRAPVWSLSRHSAGLCVRFVTDATSLQARWTLTSQALAMPHMPATGVSGLDLYVQTGPGKWRWLSFGQPNKYPTSQAVLFNGLPAGERTYLLYLPLYNGVTAVEIGIPKVNKLAKAPGREGKKPIVFYGTSITHGACASRPGMVHTAILGRRFDWPVINLGFSGNGRMDPEVVELMAELDPAVYVIDCLPNLGAKDVSERTEPLVRTLRKARPKTPIVLVEDRSYPNSFLVKPLRDRNQTSRAALKKAYEKLKADGVEGLHYLHGEDLLGDDGEATVDNSHPTDLGFMRQADAFQKVLEPLLSKEK